MPIVEDNCTCQCAYCAVGSHCRILDNSCTIKPKDRDNELWNDEIREAASPMFETGDLDEPAPKPFDPNTQ